MADILTHLRDLTLIALLHPAALVSPQSFLSSFRQAPRSSFVELLRWPNTVCARFTDSVSDAIKLALGLWYANTAVDKVIPQFQMKWIIKVSFDPK